MDNLPARIEIDVQDLDIIVREADKIFLTPTAEDFLVKFLQMKSAFDQAEKVIKERLKERAEQELPGFTSIYSDNLRVTHRSYGNKYAMVEGLEGEIPEELVETRISLKKAEEIEKWAKANGSLPYGVRLKDREKTVSISLRKDAETDS